MGKPSHSPSPSVYFLWAGSAGAAGRLARLTISSKLRTMGRRAVAEPLISDGVDMVQVTLRWGGLPLASVLNRQEKCEASLLFVFFLFRHVIQQQQLARPSAH